MPDEELRKFGKTAQYMISPTANMANQKARPGGREWMPAAQLGAPRLRQIATPVQGRKKERYRLCGVRLPQNDVGKKPGRPMRVID
jgi:hypothetical protein